VPSPANHAAPAGSRIVVAVLAAASLLAGCGSLPNPLATPTPPDGLHPRPPAQPAVEPTAVPTPVPEKLTELQRQRQVWTRTGVASYRLRMLFGCQCELGGKTVDVTVDRGKVSAASVDGTPLGLDHLVGVPATIDQLFDYAERNAGAGKDELKYDRLLGYPVALGIDPDTNARDDEIRIAILELTPGR
jgi:hypothetical protein